MAKTITLNVTISDADGGAYQPTVN